MHYIAEKYLQELEKPATPLPTLGDIVNWFKKVRCTLIFGGLSVALYSLLYIFNVDLTQIAQATHEGHKTWFLVPIVVALVFSLVHGKFTAHFWDALGIQARKTKWLER